MTAPPEIGTALVRTDAPALVVDYKQELAGAKMLIASGLVPAGVKSPEAAMFIILTGRDLGLSPVQSLRSIHVIQGKVEVAADQQLGLFHRAGGRSQWLELTNEKAVLKLVAPWLIEPHVETFTMQDAKQAKLGGDNWQKYPKAMLRSRAITAALKSIGFDPTAGCYAPGEIGGEAVVVGDVVENAPDPKANGVASPIGASPTDTTQESEAAVDAQEEAESQALREIETRLPSLTVDQQIYVKEKLGSGSDPVQLLDLIDTRMPQKAKVS